MVMTRPRGCGSSRSRDAKPLGQNGPAGTCSPRRHPAGQALACSVKHNSTLKRCARKDVWMPSRHRPQEQDARAGEKHCLRRCEVTQRSRVGAGAPRERAGWRRAVCHVETTRTDYGVACVGQMCIKGSRCLLTPTGCSDGGTHFF